MKSWAEKLADSKPEQVKRLDKPMMGMKQGQMMLIASPAIFDDFIRRIPEGTAKDIKQVRDELAQKFDADVTCPLTSGIFLRIVAEAAYEAYDNGAKIDDITPVWRVIDNKSTTAKKLSFDPQFLWNQRDREGLPE